MTDRLLLWMVLWCYASAGAITLLRMRRGNAASTLHHINVGVMMVGFAFHTLALLLRGQHLKSCPLTNLFEVQVFIAWAAVLFYLLIGPSYRVSFLGAFTAPVVFGILVTALLMPIDVLRPAGQKHSAWVEFHAAIGIVACGAFALAAVTSLMLLMQNRLLKAHRFGTLSLSLPPLDQLDVIIFRLLLLGFAMLTVGMIGGVIAECLVGSWKLPKTAWAWVVWVSYSGLIFTRWRDLLYGRRFALATVCLFVFTLIAFWEATWLSR